MFEFGLCFSNSVGPSPIIFNTGLVTGFPLLGVATAIGEGLIRGAVHWVMNYSNMLCCSRKPSRRCTDVNETTVVESGKPIKVIEQNGQDSVYLGN